MRQRITRREVIRASALLLGGACGCHTATGPAAPKSTCCATPDLEPESLTVGVGHRTIDLRMARSLRDVGNAAWITDEAKGLRFIIVRADRDEYLVLSRMCTHGGQTVSYNHRRRLLQRNNFNHSNFALDGQVLKGPAETPVKTYPVRRVDDTLAIAL